MVTANPDSRLAALATGRIIPLDFPRTGVSTAGSISFTSSVLACLSLVNPGALRPLMRHARSTFERAERDAARIRIRGSLYILGGVMTYPLAMYAAAKFYEVLGYDARYARTEQFSHMEVFSAHEGDTVVLFEEPRGRISDLVGSLGEAGLHAFCASPLDSAHLARAVLCVFVTTADAQDCRRVGHFRVPLRIRRAAARGKQRGDILTAPRSRPRLRSSFKPRFNR